MPPATLPTVDFDPKATIIARKSFVRFTRNDPATGKPSTQAKDILNLVTQKLDFEPKLDFVENKVPKGKYIIKNRKVPKEKSALFKAEVGDLKPLLAYFGNIPFNENGTLEVFVCDPDDATATVSVYIAPFACNATSDGSTSFSGDKFASTNVSFDALEDFTIQTDAPVTVAAP